MPFPVPDNSQNFDRFIPSRQASNLETAFADVSDGNSDEVSTARASQKPSQNVSVPVSLGGGSVSGTFNNMLRSELLQEDRSRKVVGTPSSRLRLRSSPSSSPGGKSIGKSPGGSTIFSYKSQKRRSDDDAHRVSFEHGYGRSESLYGGDESTPNGKRFHFPESNGSFGTNSSSSGLIPRSGAEHTFHHTNMLPQRNTLLQYSRNQTADYDRLVSADSEVLGAGDMETVLGPTDPGLGRTSVRKISRLPFKILDAPQLQDDYYLNLLDWSSQNILAVGLGSAVYLWSGYTSKVSKLCEIDGGASITSISWTGAGDYLAVGTSDGRIQLWDPRYGSGASGVKVRDLVPHGGRVGALNWHNALLASGSQDRSVFVHDVRVRSVVPGLSGGHSSSRGTLSSPRSRRSQEASPHRLTPGGSHPHTVSSCDILLNPSISASVYDQSPRSRPGADLRFPSFAPEDEGGRANAKSSVVDMIAQVTHSRPPPTPGTSVPTMISNVSETIISTPPTRSRLSGVCSDPAHLQNGRFSVGACFGNSAFSPLRARTPQVGTLPYNRRMESHDSSLLFPTPIRAGARAGPMGSSSPSVVFKLQAHKQEVCGLKWSPNGRQIATGGNDNKLFIWDVAGCNRLHYRSGSGGSGSTDSTRSDSFGDSSMDETIVEASFSSTGSSSSGSSRSGSTQGLVPLFRFDDHLAAVKAVAWSPHQNGLLASGGGTADRTIRYWNTLTGNCIQAVDTGSQVCNLAWSSSVNEVVSTHGYSLNQIIVWKYPSMHKVATLTGHLTRVVYLAMSPDGQSIVTGAGDETLRFWHLFPRSKSGAPGDSDRMSNSKYASSTLNHLYERNSFTDGYRRSSNISNVLAPTGNSIR